MCVAIDAVAHRFESISSKAYNTAVNTALVTFASLMLKQVLDAFVRVKMSIICENSTKSCCLVMKLLFMQQPQFPVHK